MNFNSHFQLAGKHAFLSASQSAWTNYEDDKLEAVFRKAEAAKRGTELHDLAANCIRLGVRMPRNSQTLNLYINDAIGFRMTPEQVLFYSDNCFGTADAVSFRNNTLRIHDLKTGVTPAGMRQLEVYAAMFCLEYRYKPPTIKTELRIYQNDEVKVYEPDPGDIISIMDTIVRSDNIIRSIQAEEM